MCEKHKKYGYAVPVNGEALKAPEGFTMTNKKNSTPAPIEAAANKNMTALREAMTAAVKRYDAATSTKTELTAAAYLDIVEQKDKAVNAYNAAALTACYDRFLSADGSPVAALAKCLHWSRLVATTSKDGGTMLRGRSTRFNLIDFINYAADTETPIVNGDAIKSAMKTAAETLSAYVLAQVTKEGGMSIDAPKKALQSALDTLGIDKLFACSKDVRFIAYAVTHARELGELAKITPATVCPFIMDVVNAHINKVSYHYAEEKKEEKAE